MSVVDYSLGGKKLRRKTNVDNDFHRKEKIFNEKGGRKEPRSPRMLPCVSTRDLFLIHGHRGTTFGPRFLAKSHVVLLCSITLIIIARVSLGCIKQ